MNRFESLKIGDKAELRHKITQSDIDQFVELTGDDNKIHVDKEYSGKTSYKKPVVHGMLGASFISTVIGTKLPGDGAVWFSQNLEFLSPVRVGDTITVKVEILNKIERTRTIELKTDIFNQNNQKVTTGTAKVKVVEQKTVPSKAKDKKDDKRIALVIGGTGGIGREVCLQLAKDGFDIAIHYHQNKALAQEIQKQIIGLGRKAIVVNGDVVDFQQVEEMVNKICRQFQIITLVVNCAAKDIPNIKLSDLKWDDIQGHLDMNIKGIFNIQKCVVPIMAERKYGKIINITTQAIEKPNAEWLHYITAKSGLHGFTKALALELAPKGIRVNLVSPGMTDTELIANIPERVRLLTEAQTPLGRIATAQDIAGTISFLASEKSDFLTGETIRVNGGQVML
ncbi:MAG TPA: SDR family oxidoreductase [Candidatus Omnitrophota bacterium]|nr:SDR family oxidoreductase [Candidatus Omnitrophota bacterium]